MNEKIELYNRATDELVLLAHDYDLPQIGKFSFPEIVHLLRESFKHPLTHEKIFDYKQLPNWVPSTNFCAVASFFIYEHTGGPDQWKFMRGPAHWWLEHKRISGQFDITYDQFAKPYDYRNSSIENNEDRLSELQKQALILGRAAGMV